MLLTCDRIFLECAHSSLCMTLGVIDLRVEGGGDMAIERTTGLESCQEAAMRGRQVGRVSASQSTVPTHQHIAEYYARIQCMHTQKYLNMKMAQRQD